MSSYTLTSDQLKGCRNLTQEMEQELKVNPTVALYHAVKNNDTYILKEAIDTGKADVNYPHGQEQSCECCQRKNSDFETPLMVAVDEGNLEITKMLVEAGADVNWQSEYDGYTAFLVACYHGNAEIGAYLLSKGSRLDACLTNGRNALHLVITSRGGDRDDGSTKHIELLKLILSKQLPDKVINGQTNDTGGHFSTHWLTPLDTAIIWNETDLAKLLIQRGAKFNVMKKSNNLCRGKYSEKARLLEKIAKKEAAHMAQHLDGTSGEAPLLTKEEIMEGMQLFSQLAGEDGKMTPAMWDATQSEMEGGEGSVSKLAVQHFLHLENEARKKESELLNELAEEEAAAERKKKKKKKKKKKGKGGTAAAAAAAQEEEDAAKKAVEEAQLKRMEDVAAEQAKRDAEEKKKQAGIAAAQRPEESGGSSDSDSSDDDGLAALAGWMSKKGGPKSGGSSERKGTDASRKGGGAKNTSSKAAGPHKDPHHSEASHKVKLAAVIQESQSLVNAVRRQDPFSGQLATVEHSGLSRTTKILFGENQGIEVLLGGADGGRLKVLSRTMPNPEAYQSCNLVLENLGCQLRLRSDGNNAVELYNSESRGVADVESLGRWHSFAASFVEGLTTTKLPLKAKQGVVGPPPGSQDVRRNATSNARTVGRERVAHVPVPARLPVRRNVAGTRPGGPGSQVPPVQGGRGQPPLGLKSGKTASVARRAPLLSPQTSSSQPRNTRTVAMASRHVQNNQPSPSALHRTSASPNGSPNSRGTPPHSLSPSNTMRRRTPPFNARSTPPHSPQLSSPHSSPHGSPRSARSNTSNTSTPSREAFKLDNGGTGSYQQQAPPQHQQQMSAPGLQSISSIGTSGFQVPSMGQQGGGVSFLQGMQQMHLPSHGGSEMGPPGILHDRSLSAPGYDRGGPPQMPQPQSLQMPMHSQMQSWGVGGGGGGGGGAGYQQVSHHRQQPPSLAPGMHQHHSQQPMYHGMQQHTSQQMSMPSQLFTGQPSVSMHNSYPSNPPPGLGIGQRSASDPIQSSSWNSAGDTVSSSMWGSGPTGSNNGGHVSMGMPNPTPSSDWGSAPSSGGNAFLQPPPGYNITPRGSGGGSSLGGDVGTSSNAFGSSGDVGTSSNAFGSSGGGGGSSLGGDVGTSSNAFGSSIFMSDGSLGVSWGASGGGKGDTRQNKSTW
jgi:hypothetical protein